MNYRTLIIFTGLLCGTAPSLLGASGILDTPEHGQRIMSIGGAIGERMLHYPHFETELQLRYPESALEYYNMSRSGDTAGFRAHSARNSPWAFPGAEAFHPQTQSHFGEGHYDTPDEWLEEFKADTILGFFGYAESFGGEDALPLFRAELEAFVDHSLQQRYNDTAAPMLVLISPIAFEDLSESKFLPDGREANRNLERYAEVMEAVAREKGVGYVNLFEPTRRLFASRKSEYTINGHLPNDAGYRAIAQLLVDALYGKSNRKSPASYEQVYDGVVEKNWSWGNDYHILNGVHVYGRRYNPFGDENYPEEIEKIRQMTRTRIEALRVTVETGGAFEVDDTSTRELTEIETNYDTPIEFLDPQEALTRMTLPDGYKIELFASEKQFPDLGSPVQMSFDSKGRLWVSVIPSYPHYRPGDGKPNDKIIILEDTDNDGRADKQTVFADGLHMPIGFEIAEEGVYVAQQPNLVLLIDEDGDDRADRKEFLVHGFDTHDTHHSISAFSAGPDGTIYMAEGRFLHSQVETPYGVERMADGGVWRFNPRTWKLERAMQTDVSNPWGIAFNEWGELFLADASGGDNWWGLPLSAKAPHAYEVEKVAQFTTERVRPTSSAEFISSRHFPDAVQGDFLLHNTIGFLGTKQHTMEVDSEGGYTGTLRHDLISSKDPNFRPVDMEFAPDGSLYLIDWHNPLIGHMQHSARDPNRDKAHGRIYRITYPSRPLVVPAKIDGASIEELLGNLELPEYRTRYRSRRELRGRSADKVAKAVKQWVSGLSPERENYERLLLEALWVGKGVGKFDEALLRRCLEADDYQCRAVAVGILRDEFQQVEKAGLALLNASSDEHSRVRLAAIAAGTWVSGKTGAVVVLEALTHPVTQWMKPTFNAALETLSEDVQALVEQERELNDRSSEVREYVFNQKKFAIGEKPQPKRNLAADDMELFNIGKEVYHRDAYCVTCHGEKGEGAIKGIYPPLIGSEWVNGNDERLIKIVLKGLTGKIEVGGHVYDPVNGVPPMTAFESLLSDEEIAGVLTYIRVAFADKKASSRRIESEQIQKVREDVKDKKGFYTPEELLDEHPME